MGRTEMKKLSKISTTCKVCKRPIVQAELHEAAATAWRSHVWLDKNGESGVDAGLPSYHEHTPEQGVMNDTDHRAEAVRLAKLAEKQVGDLPLLDPVEAMEAYIHLAQLHVDLAAVAAHTPAGHPVLPYREALTELRKAVRYANLHQRGGGPAEFITLQRAQWNTIVELAEGSK